jgi:hypothetical protein
MTSYELSSAMGDLILQLVPRRCFMWMLWAYMRSTAGLTRVKRGWALLRRMFWNTVHPVQLRFFMWNDTHIPHIARHHEPFPLVVHGKLNWVYNPDEKRFEHVTINEYPVRALGILGATLCYANQQENVKADLSEWIGDLKVKAPDAFVPYDALIAAWSHDTGEELHLPLSDYVLKVTHLTAEEEIISFPRQET